MVGGLTALHHPPQLQLHRGEVAGAGILRSLRHVVWQHAHAHPPAILVHLDVALETRGARGT